MKNECNIIRDILPLYAEDMVSADTSAFVEEHLTKCAECRAELENLKNEDLLGHVSSDKYDTDTLPLKTIKKKWKSKKIALVCTTVLITIAIVCCALFAYTHLAYQEEISVNGAVYTQNGDNVIKLPADSKELGYLRGISHKSTSNPTGDFMATNLDEKYAGCPIYQSGTDDSVIYLEDYSGFYIPFELTELITQPELPDNESAE